MDFAAIRQISNNEWKFLRGAARIETSDFLIRADEIDYNSDTHWAYARHHVQFEHFATGDKLEADHGEYNLETRQGKFFAVRGTSPAKILSRPGLLTTSNPFTFQGQWAERLRDRYVLHHGFITDCRVQSPWWVFRASVFDIIPQDRAVGRNALFSLKRVPLLYAPVFYRPLGSNPRKSGFLTPNLGNSSRRGYMLGGGYYWAINRSFDAIYRLQYFTDRGPAHTLDFRGKPTQKTDLNFSLYGVQDRGVRVANGPLQKQGGAELELTARTELPRGFVGRLDFNYLSSFLFRLTFNDSFYAAISSQVNSIGYLQKHWTNYVLTFSAERNELFESALPNDRVIIDRIPTVSFAVPDRPLLDGPVPFWVSFESSAGGVRRLEPSVRTSLLLDREDFEPRIMTRFSFKGFTLVPAFTLSETHYGESFGAARQPTGGSLLRGARSVRVDLTTPALERVMNLPSWLHLGTRLKHVIEPRVSFAYVGGVTNFQRIIHFEPSDLLADTTQLELSLTNRFYRKAKDGSVSEIASWEIGQQRYFNQNFGGVLIPGQRNVVLAATEFSPYSLLLGPRNYSPFVSNLRFYPTPLIGLEWHAGYDPLVQRLTDSTVSAGLRFANYFLTVGQTKLNLYPQGAAGPTLTGSSNQITWSFGYGNPNRKGWNAASALDYDYTKQFLIYQTTQLAYNTDCCGLSFQVRRFAIGTRNENQFRIAFAIANIGSFGTLNRQDRIY